MPRPSRYAPGGMVFHVVNRGVGRRNLFDKDGDFLAFERVMLETLRVVPMRVCAYCLGSAKGVSDGCNARVADSSLFPLLATLHALIRSNGCSRVIETGTAHGVSAACMASAVLHRESPLVVSLDPAVYADRDELWALLPERMRVCIKPRQVDAFTGLRQAIENGETYHAALLDSIHTVEHVLQEFELAKQLVCRGGLILIHDPLWAGGTVNHAVEQIAGRGYPVVRLWSAEEGVQEDDRLGLAIIENRCFDALHQ